jgi:predicted MFS family arabinose efflux permease
VVKGPWAAVIIAGVALSGSAGMFVIFTADMLARVPPAAVGMAASITATGQSLAFVLSSPLIGRAVDQTGSYSLPILVVALLGVPGIATFLLWRPAEPTPVRAPAASPA